MVLVVDDDDGVVGALRVWLKKRGFEVVSCRDGQEAYRYVKRKKCKCMILDIHMPNINGIELLILMQAEGIKVPTIVMAGFDDFDEAEMKNFSNVVKFFKKPFDMKEMMSTVEECTAG
jgi:two-component system response regulator HydG